MQLFESEKFDANIVFLGVIVYGQEKRLRRTACGGSAEHYRFS